MIESILKLNGETPWFPGIRQDFGVKSDIGGIVGKLSITRFTTINPFEIKWIYLNRIEITDEINRNSGYGYRAMLELNKQIELEGANGILKNSIRERDKKDFYKKMGWIKSQGVGGRWEFLLTQEVSTFVLRDVVNNIVRRNFVR